MGRIALVGEAWGRNEAEQGKPFVGYAGRILRGLLHQVGINFDECLVTNVFNLQPKPTNNILNLCGPKSEAIPGHPPLQRGKYVRREFAGELERLYRELNDFKPNVIVALGGTASWALLDTSSIKSIRGFIAEGVRVPFKVLPTLHPAAIGREWTQRPIVLADLTKAKREAEFPEVRRPRRELWLEPTLRDVAEFIERFIEPEEYLSVDIETISDQITCIGFAPTIDRALVIPFYDPRQPDGNYWRTKEDEMQAWALVRHILTLGKKIVGQNYMYDMHFLWRQYGIPSLHVTHDTMLMHHALQPEMEKGLGFLASIYTDECQWKGMRKAAKTRKKGE